VIQQQIPQLDIEAHGELATEAPETPPHLYRFANTRTQPIEPLLTLDTPESFSAHLCEGTEFSAHINTIDQQRGSLDERDEDVPVTNARIHEQ
jgi:hypothetical protein